MNGTVAKRIRRMCYPFSICRDLRDYHRMPDGRLQAMGFRRKYKDAKKEYKRGIE
jgi:hypothetical protein